MIKRLVGHFSHPISYRPPPIQIHAIPPSMHPPAPPPAAAPAQSPHHTLPAGIYISSKAAGSKSASSPSHCRETANQPSCCSAASRRVRSRQGGAASCLSVRSLWRRWAAQQPKHTCPAISRFLSGSRMQPLLVPLRARHSDPSLMISAQSSTQISRLIATTIALHSRVAVRFSLYISASWKRLYASFYWML